MSISLRLCHVMRTQVGKFSTCITTPSDERFNTTNFMGHSLGKPTYCFGARPRKHRNLDLLAMRGLAAQSVINAEKGPHEILSHGAPNEIKQNNDIGIL